MKITVGQKSHWTDQLKLLKTKTSLPALKLIFLKKKTRLNPDPAA